MDLQNVKSHKYIVYGLIDPNSKELRYIGKTIQGYIRICQHLSLSGLKNDGKTHKANWLRKLNINNQKPEVSILFTLGDTNLEKTIINEILYKKEQEFIDLYTILETNLTNSQDGGLGSPGRKLSKESKKKMSESAKKRGLPKALKEQQKPKFQDTETHKFCSKCNSFKEYNEFIKKSRKCKPCFNKNRKSRIIPGAKEKYNNSMKIKVYSINPLTNKKIQYNGLRNAAKIIGGKCNHFNIKQAIKNNKLYYNLMWSYS